MQKILFTFLFLSIFFLFNAFQPAPKTEVELIRESYEQDMSVFLNDLGLLEKSTKQRPFDAQDLQQSYRNARLSYKKIAWLLGYIDPENEKNFNGAALLRVEERFLVESEPLGFQPLEELVFADELEASDTAQMQHLAQELRFHAQKWQEQIHTQALSDREILEALRTELSQLFTLSLTGFDSPVSFHSLPESMTAWRKINDIFAVYSTNLIKKDPNLKKAIDKNFSDGKAFFQKNTDFNTFDRIAFYKTAFEPLYKNLVAAQKALGVEFYRLTGNPLRAWNDEANNLFSPDFVNANYFSDIKDPNYEDSEARINLGKILFFDKNMSKNGKNACASCHRPENGFAESFAKSMDLEGKPLDRNAPSLNYATMAKTQFWDAHAPTVELQFAHVVTNNREMGLTMEGLPAKLKSEEKYRTAFAAAFPNQGEEAIRFENAGKAVGSYLRSLATFDSDFDRFMRSETKELKEDAKQGFNLFMGKAKCGTCHFAPVFNGTAAPFFLDTEYEVLGVPNEKDELDEDLGKYKVVPHEKMRHAFKTMTTRNAALTAPYMHNGRYQTLQEVVSFYNKGGGIGMGLDVKNQTLPSDSLGLSEKEQSQLVAFLQSLTTKKIFSTQLTGGKK